MMKKLKAKAKEKARAGAQNKDCSGASKGKGLGKQLEHLSWLIKYSAIKEINNKINQNLYMNKLLQQGMNPYVEAETFPVIPLPRCFKSGLTSEQKSDQHLVASTCALPSGKIDLLYLNPSNGRSNKLGVTAIASFLHTLPGADPLSE